MTKIVKIRKVNFFPTTNVQLLVLAPNQPYPCSGYQCRGQARMRLVWASILAVPCHWTACVYCKRGFKFICHIVICFNLRLALALSWISTYLRVFVYVLLQIRIRTLGNKSSFALEMIYIELHIQVNVVATYVFLLLNYVCFTHAE